jgi:hypothetical protein
MVPPIAELGGSNAGQPAFNKGTLREEIQQVAIAYQCVALLTARRLIYYGQNNL